MANKNISNTIRSKTGTKAKPILSIVIPVYNEKATLKKIIRKVESVSIPGVKKEIILVDDCSTDGSRAVLKSLEKTGKYTVLFHKVNQGKGAALRTSFRKAKGDIIVVQDADLEYDPSDLKKLILPILCGKSDVVYGSRFIGQKFHLSGRKKTMHPLHFIGNKSLTFITALLFFNKITDMETCYKMFRKEVIKGMKLKARRFDFEPEITAKILKSGYKILELPIHFHPRGFEEGKKITWRDGIMHFFYLLRYRFSD